VPDGLRVLTRLGEIAGGELYAAEYFDSHVEVELLIIRPETGVEAAADRHVRLRDQLHRSARIKHPNVASVCAIGETEDGALWATFEALQGKLLSDALGEGDVPPPHKAIELVLQAASGLRAAHEVGLIHGNVSPGSILMTRTPDDRPLVKLIRFGSLQLGERSLGIGESTGYAAPERLAGETPDERSDVFSLGAVLHHLLTGTPPSAEPDVALPIPEAARRVLAKALELPPEDRFQTIAAFARALTMAISRPPARTRKGARGLGRLAGVLAAAAIIAGAVLWLLGSRSPSDPGNASVSAMTAGKPIMTGEARDTSAELDRAPLLIPEIRLEGDADAGAASDSRLVDVRSIDSTIQVDLRYATANNFTGAALPGYEAKRALLRGEAAAALGRVQARLRSRGFGLRVFDAYRPVRASRAMVDWAERTGRKTLLENGYITPRSRHNLGVAVDVTMVHLATGAEVSMGTTFDNFIDTAARNTNVSGAALRSRQILADAMQSEGFRPLGQAWWHFNYPLDGAAALDRVIR
jgi:D-alanyl-D-alanine dipeptidase